MTTKIDARTAFLMTLPPLLWAGNAIVGRLMVGTMPPLMLNFLRWVFAAAILLLLGWRILRRPGLLLARWSYLLPAGVLGVGAYNALQYQALVTTTPLNVTLIASTSPVWMLAVGSLFYGAKPTARQIVGAMLSLLGAALVVTRGDLLRIASVKLVPGDLYILIAIIAWAFYSWLLAKPPASMREPQRPTIEEDGRERAWDWSEFLLAQTLFGLLVAGAVAGVEQGIGTTDMQWGWKTWVALIYVAVGPSIIAYRCWGLGVAKGGPTLAAFFGNLTPVFAAVMSASMLGEWPSWYHFAAFGLIVAGILWSMRKGTA